MKITLVSAQYLTSEYWNARLTRRCKLYDETLTEALCHSPDM